MLETRNNTDLETWIDLRVSDIIRKMEKRRLDGEKRRTKFREKMANLKERYEKLMERRFERMRKDGTDMTLEEFRSRPDPETLRKLRNIEEEEYQQLFGDGNMPSTSVDTTKIDNSPGEDEEYNSDDKENDDANSDASDFDSDRVEVDCELYGISSSHLKFQRARSNINILRPVITGQDAESSSLNKLKSLMMGKKTEEPRDRPDISILRPTILEEPTVEEPPRAENTELDTVVENVGSTVKTIKLKQKQKKHHHHHTKPKPIRANSQANFLSVKKLGNKTNSDSTDISAGGNPVIHSEQKEKLRKASGKASAVNAIAGNIRKDSLVEREPLHEAGTKKKPPDSTTISNSSIAITIQARSVLKKRSSRAMIHNDSMRNLRQNESHN